MAHRRKTEKENQDDRFVTAYQASFNIPKQNRPQTAAGPRKRSENLILTHDNPASKDDKKLATVSSSRRFAEYPKNGVKKPAQTQRVPVGKSTFCLLSTPEM